MNENSFKAKGRFLSEDGQLDLEEFELKSGDSVVSSLDSTERDISEHFSRILLALLRYKTENQVRFPKKDQPWKALWEFLRRIYRKGSKPDWYQRVFHEVDLNILFPDTTQDRPNKKYLIINGKDFSPESIEISICQDDGDNDLPDPEKLAHLEFLAGYSEDDETENIHTNWDEEFARELAGELQVTTGSNRDRLLIGKTIWLSRLVFLNKLLSVELMSEDGYIGFLQRDLRRQTRDASDASEEDATTQEQSFLRPNDYVKWIARVDAIKRIIEKKFLSVPATKSGFDVDSIQAHMGKLILETTKYTKGDLDRTSLQQTVTDIESQLSNEITSLNEKVAECRECFHLLWKGKGP